MNSTSGGSRLRAPTSATFAAVDRAVVDEHSQRHPPGVAGGRRGGRVQIAVGVDPDDGKRLVAGGKPFDRPEMRAAAAAEHERAVGQLRGDHQRLLGERRRLDDARLGIRQLEPRGGSAIASPPLPQARGTRTRPAPNSRPHEWHWYSGPIATAVSVLQSGQRARSRLTYATPRCPCGGPVASRPARRAAPLPSCSRRRRRARSA